MVPTSSLKLRLAARAGTSYDEESGVLHVGNGFGILDSLHGAPMPHDNLTELYHDVYAVHPIVDRAFALGEPLRLLA